MPNHVYNIITINKEDEQRFKDYLCEENEVRFQKIIPMPEDLNIDSCGSSNEVFYKFLNNIGTDKERYTEMHNCMNPRWTFVSKEDENKLKIPVTFKEDIDKYVDNRKDNIDLENGKLQYENTLKYEHPDWYSWRLHNWGTKWDAYDQNEWYDENDKYNTMFCTAWSAPMPIYEKLMRDTMNIDHNIIWAEEFYGNNTGQITHVKHEPVYFINIPENYSEESNRLAAEVFGEWDEVEE